MCDLCKEHSDRIIRVNAWQVCQWCVSNNVLEHALEVESDIANLSDAVAKTSATHERDVRSKAVAETKLELAYAAYADLSTAMEDLAKSTAASKESLRIALDATKTLQDYKHHEEKTRKAHRHHVHA